MEHLRTTKYCKTADGHRELVLKPNAWRGSGSLGFTKYCGVDVDSSRYEGSENSLEHNNLFHERLAQYLYSRELGTFLGHTRKHAWALQLLHSLDILLGHFHLTFLLNAHLIERLV